MYTRTSTVYRTAQGICMKFVIGSLHYKLAECLIDMHRFDILLGLDEAKIAAFRFLKRSI